MLISNNEDTICGAQRSIEKAISGVNNQTTVKIPDPPSQTPILHNEDVLAAAFRQAELDEQQFRAKGGFIPEGNEHNNEPQLNPTIPPIPSNSNSAEVIQRPTTKSGELSIRQLSTGTNREIVTNKQPILPTEVNEQELPKSTENIDNSRINPAFVPNLKPPTKIHPAYPLNTHTLPPSIVIATENRQDKRVDLTSQTTVKNNASMTPTAQLNPTRMSPPSTKFQERELFGADELHRVSTSQSPTQNNSVELRGDRSLPTLLIIICLSTVGIVVLAVFVGMCFVHRRRGQQLFGSSNSSARSNSYYGTNTVVNQHPNNYVSPNQFNASQMETLQRAR